MKAEVDLNFIPYNVDTKQNLEKENVIDIWRF